MTVKLTRTDNGALPLVTGYGDGGFRVSGQRHEGSLLIVNGVLSSLPVTAIGDLAPEHVAAVMAADPGVEIFLIGCGASLAMPPAPLRAALEAAKVAYDPMDTGAAARTYNVLMLEDRRVAVALIAV